MHTTTAASAPTTPPIRAPVLEAGGGGDGAAGACACGGEFGSSVRAAATAAGEPKPSTPIRAVLAPIALAIAPLARSACSCIMTAAQMAEVDVEPAAAASTRELCEAAEASTTNEIETAVLPDGCRSRSSSCCCSRRAPITAKPTASTPEAPMPSELAIADAIWASTVGVRAAASAAPCSGMTSTKATRTTGCRICEGAALVDDDADSEGLGDNADATHTVSDAAEHARATAKPSPHSEHAVHASAAPEALLPKAVGAQAQTASEVGEPAVFA